MATLYQRNGVFYLSYYEDAKRIRIPVGRDQEIAVLRLRQMNSEQQQATGFPPQCKEFLEAERKLLM